MGAGTLGQSSVLPARHSGLKRQGKERLLASRTSTSDVRTGRDYSERYQELAACSIYTEIVGKPKTVTTKV